MAGGGDRKEQKWEEGQPKWRAEVTAKSENGKRVNYYRLEKVPVINNRSRILNLMKRK